MEHLPVDTLRGLGMIFGQTFEREKKDLEAYTSSARLLIEGALSLATKRPDQYKEYASVALNNSYNLSAACYPAWDTDSYGVPDDKLELGLAAAEFNVELAEKLEVGPDRMKNGHWIKGAHLACRSQFDAAKESFQRCEHFSEAAGDQDAVLMSEGWCVLMDYLLGAADAESKLRDIKTALAARGDDGEFYAGQYEPLLGYLSAN